MSRSKQMNSDGSARISGQHIVSQRQMAAVPVGPQKAGAPEAPQIEVIRHGQWVQALDITCTCGCQLRVLCEYGSDP